MHALLLFWSSVLLVGRLYELWSASERWVWWIATCCGLASTGLFLRGDRPHFESQRTAVEVAYFSLLKMYLPFSPNVVAVRVANLEPKNNDTEIIRSSMKKHRHKCGRVLLKWIFFWRSKRKTSTISFDFATGHFVPDIKSKISKRLSCVD
jgi:hypothetical protein